MDSGWLMTLLACIVFGLTTYFSAYLVVMHLGDCPNIKEAILVHFKGDQFYALLYNAVVGTTILGMIISFF